MEIDPIKQSLKGLVEAAVQEGSFTLASGRKSKYYIDGKKVTLDQKGAHLCSKLLFAMLQDLRDVTAIGGPVIGANPIVSTLGHVCFEGGMPLKMFYVRKEEKSHGLQRWIEGPALDGEDQAIILEDVITTGSTVVHAAKRVRETGAKVSKVMCLVDREEGGTDALRKAGLECIPLFTATELGLK